MKRLSNILMKGLAAVLPIGEMNRRYYRHFGVRDSKMFSAPYFVDNARFAAAAARADRRALRSRWAIPSNAFCFVFSGKLEEKKHPEAIVQALASPDRRLLMQERARQRALRRFTADCMVEATLTVYREAIA